MGKFLLVLYLTMNSFSLVLPDGVRVVESSAAICLYRSRFFDLILEIDNALLPYKIQHVAGALRPSSTADLLSQLRGCKDRKLLVVSPEGKPLTPK